MNAAADVGSFLVRNLMNLFLMIVLLRVLMQIAKVDFYNPISQAIVKVSNPLLLPLRRVIPGFGGLDMAGIVLAVLIQLIATTLLLKMSGYPFQNPANMLAWGGLGIIALVLNIYLFTVLASIVVSWVAPQSVHPAISLLHQFTEPVLAPFRKLLPSMGGLDLSPIFLFLSINVCQILVRHAAMAVKLPPAFVLGF